MRDLPQLTHVANMPHLAEAGSDWPDVLPLHIMHTCCNHVHTFNNGHAKLLFRMQHHMLAHEDCLSVNCSCRYNRLYTLTAQTKEADFVGTKGTLQEVLGSFRPPAPVI